MFDTKLEKAIKAVDDCIADAPSPANVEKLESAKATLESCRDGGVSTQGGGTGNGPK